jgi:hypothetical protein
MSRHRLHPQSGEGVARGTHLWRRSGGPSIVADCATACSRHWMTCQPKCFAQSVLL